MDALGRIRRLMEQQGWTEYQLAKEAGLPQSTITNMFRRQTAPTIPTLERICQAVGISLARFFAPEDDMMELTDEQVDMFHRWAALTERQKELVAELIDNMK